MATAEDDWKRSFADTSVRLQDLVRQLNSCKTQIFQRDREGRMADATARQLKLLEQQHQASGGLVTYKAVGKMFIQEQPSELVKEYENAMAKSKRDVNILDKTREYLEKNVLDQEKTLKELLNKQK